MIYPEDFIAILQKAAKPEERSVMARVALNILYDPDSYPVDLSEVLTLGQESRMLARGFLAYCAINPNEYLSYSDRLVSRLSKFIALPPSTEDDE